MKNMTAETHVLDLKGRVRIIQMIEEKGWNSRWKAFGRRFRNSMMWAQKYTWPSAPRATGERMKIIRVRLK